MCVCVCVCACARVCVCVCVYVYVIDSDSESARVLSSVYSSISPPRATSSNHHTLLLTHSCTASCHTSLPLTLAVPFQIHKASLRFITDSRSWLPELGLEAQKTIVRACVCVCVTALSFSMKTSSLVFSLVEFVQLLSRCFKQSFLGMEQL